ncbi:hypothetical protein N7G274_006744 [Stereocaulon virgatum]|uniref:Uncharacterized protein n=1 Tax=Stereocaulon virgatum TaxID=373712 RepID=A0ABR4A4M5_9LECA
MANSMLESEQVTGSPEISIANSRTVTALSNSQESSLNQSSNSQLSQYRPESAGDLHPSQGERGHGGMTPSTSYTNSPTYECMRKDHLNDDVGVVTQDELESAHALNMRPLPDQSKEPLIEYTAAPKRMANGDIKPAGYNSTTSPIDASQHGHSRNSSRASRSSQIGELSSQLRTRLSYAMVKVQNGWQSHSITELEGMTSNQASPISGLSDQRQLFESASADAHPASYSASMQSPKRLALAPEFTSALLRTARFAPGLEDMPPQYGDPTPDPQPHQVGATYESFWREHEGGSALRPSKAMTSPTGRPSLAPPVDIVPRSQRRSDASKRQLPTLHTSDLYGADDQRFSSFSTLPTTPPKRTPKMRTPSQQAAVEKDAVETLLFMSSPDNPGYHPPAALAVSPLRSSFAPLPTQSVQQATFRREGAGVQKSTLPIPSLMPRSRPQLSEADVDKMLDEAPDTSSSDDDDPHNQRSSQQSLGS